MFATAAGLAAYIMAKCVLPGTIFQELVETVTFIAHYVRILMMLHFLSTYE